MNNSKKSRPEQNENSRHMAEQSAESQMLQLSELVGQIAQKLDRYAAGRPKPETSIGFNDRELKMAERRRAKRILNAAAAAGNISGNHSVRANSVLEPDPRQVRQIIRQRKLRTRFFDDGLFGDPAWDMLLELTAARAENTQISVTSLCFASGVPPTTALRWIAVMTEAGLFERVADMSDRRRAFITLTDKAIDAMARYFAKLDSSAGLFS